MCFWQRLKHCWYLLRRRGGRFSTPEASSDHGNDFADFLPYGKHPDSQLPGTFFFFLVHFWDRGLSGLPSWHPGHMHTIWREIWGNYQRKLFSHSKPMCFSLPFSLYTQKLFILLMLEWSRKKTMISQGTQLLPTQTDPPSVSFFLQVNMGAYIFLSLCSGSAHSGKEV